MKVIALYLPQYHEVQENNEWWGSGYTEWTALKRGKKLIEGQYQPRIPLNKNYYNLLDIDVMRWQVDIAKKYGIYGFCFYHYWFDGKLLLEKPIEQFLESDIDFPFFLCWANEKWTTVWKGETEPKVLLMDDCKNKEMIDKHFYFYLKFFKDKRYIRDNNKPILCIYNPLEIEYNYLKYMIMRWDVLAKENGLDGIIFTYKSAEAMAFMTKKQKALFEYGFEYEPKYVEFLEKNIKMQKNSYYIKDSVKRLLLNYPKAENLVIKLFNNAKSFNKKVSVIRQYDKTWLEILSIKHKDYSKYIPGGFVDWDNTPRRGKKGKVILGATPEKFKKYFELLLIRTKEIYHKDMIVLFAWNEWSEGGYLEPDEKWKYGYLEAIKAVLIKHNEMPRKS